MRQTSQREPLQFLEIHLVHGRQVLCVGIRADGKFYPQFMHPPEPFNHAFIGVPQVLFQVGGIIRVLTVQFAQVIADGRDQVDIIFHHVPVYVIITERIQVLHTVDTGVNGYPA